MDRYHLKGRMPDTKNCEILGVASTVRGRWRFLSSKIPPFAGLL